ncbi:OLC1v1014058C1 [Oldenlandia corymbosa var. corymbosa]|uniref:OLC1v1014058C1 n=1 Tax=Oldenlandia corymbosa var. corymbosa TaxID=529605 RepID=A0AAV1DZR8_OLDCO|nr:OLC1v1014058C1 [Oldenlandia corymbosa var. corymbosa]
MAVKTAELHDSKSLKRETRVLKKLKGNPYIVECCGADISHEGDARSKYYNLLMEYANRGTLNRLMNSYNKGELPESHLACYAFMLLKGISSIHKKGIIHCDLKPDNVLVFNDHEGYNFLKLADFGVSKSKDGENIYGVRGATHASAPEMRINREQKLLRLEIPDYVSPSGKDFVTRCLQFDANNSRWTADELLEHPFIQENLRGMIPTLDLRQSELTKRSSNNPLSGSQSLTKELFGQIQSKQMLLPHQLCPLSIRIAAEGGKMRFLWLLMLIRTIGSSGHLSRNVTTNVSGRPSFVNIGSTLTLDSFIGKAAKVAMDAAVEDVNINLAVLSGTKLNVTTFDSGHSGFLGIVEGNHLVTLLLIKFSK